MTSNLTEEIRVAIGKLLLVHEFQKLFKVYDSHFLETIKVGVEHLGNEASTGNEIGVRNFWNLVDSLMMGYKLKDITHLVTSSQIDWNLANLKIDNLRFASDISKIEGFDITGKTAREVSTYLNGHSDTFENTRVKTQREFATASSRVNDPVIVEEHTDGTLHVHDGNGRLLEAIIEKRDSINAYIGTHKNVSKSNHWVPTSYLMRLSDERQGELLIRVLQESDNAIFEFKNRVYTEEEFKREILNVLDLDTSL